MVLPKPPYDRLIQEEIKKAGVIVAGFGCP
jgi:hypothetical protein